MSDVLTEVRSDLQAEHAALDAVLVRLQPPQWELPTHAPGWLVRDQVAHLANTDESAALAIADAAGFRERARASRKVAPEDGYLAKARALPPAELLGWWRTVSSNLIEAAATVQPQARLPWFGPEMSAVSFLTARLMETWSHGLDIVDVVDVARPDTDRLRHIAFLGVRTRPFSYLNRQLQPNNTPVRVELIAPSGATWVFGDEDAPDRITGPAADFCMVVTQRRHPDDTRLVITGEAAREWMGLAQAFAGPPGQGRRPGEFGRAAGASGASG